MKTASRGIVMIPAWGITFALLFNLNWATTFFLPFLHRHGFRWKTDTNSRDFARVCLIRCSISFVLYLLQGFSSRTIQFKLKYIYIILCLQYTVHSSSWLSFLHMQLAIYPKQTENQIESILKMFFCRFNRLYRAMRIIRYIRCLLYTSPSPRDTR